MKKKYSVDLHTLRGTQQKHCKIRLQYINMQMNILLLMYLQSILFKLTQSELRPDKMQQSQWNTCRKSICAFLQKALGTKQTICLRWALMHPRPYSKTVLLWLRSAFSLFPLSLFFPPTFLFCRLPSRGAYILINWVCEIKAQELLRKTQSEIENIHHCWRYPQSSINKFVSVAAFKLNLKVWWIFFVSSAASAATTLMTKACWSNICCLSGLKTDWNLVQSDERRPGLLLTCGRVGEGCGVVSQLLPPAVPTVEPSTEAHQNQPGGHAQTCDEGRLLDDPCDLLC